MGLINAVAGSGDEVESRCEVRGELRRRGLDHAIEMLMAQEPTQTFLVQAEIYQQETREDLAELSQLRIQYLTPDALSAVQEEDEAETSSGELGEQEVHDGHLAGLYDEISDLRDQVRTVLVPSPSCQV